MECALVVCLAIGQMRNLRVLELHFAIQEGQRDREGVLWRFLAKGLRSCRALVSVKLEHVGLTRWQDVWLPCLQCRAIREFATEGIRLDETCTRTIASWRHLQCLDLGMIAISGCCLLSQVLESAGVSERLEVLAIGQRSWCDDLSIWPDLIGCLSGFRRLRRLVIRHADLVSGRVPLLRLPSRVREVVLEGCFSDDAPADPKPGAVWMGWLIAQLAHLEVLDFSVFVSDECLRIVADYIPTGALHTLSFACLLTPSVVPVLCELLDRCSCLVSLSFSACAIREVCDQLVLAFNRMASLREVNFGSSASLRVHLVPGMLRAGFILSCSDPIIFLRPARSVRSPGRS